MLKSQRFSALLSPLSLPALLGPRPWEQKSSFMQTYCQWRNYWCVWTITGPWPLQISHLRVLRELAGYCWEAALYNLWEVMGIGECSRTLGEHSHCPIFKKGLNKNALNYQLISLTSVPGKVTVRILLGAVKSQMNHMVGKSWHRFTKGKSFLADLTAS